MVIHWATVAEEELTLDPEPPVELTDAPSSAEEPVATGEAADGFALDEQTLGRSSSVFDSGVDLMPPLVPPPATPLPPGAPQPGMMPPGATMSGPPVAPPAQDPGGVAIIPMSQRERRRRVRLEARRVRRIVRHIEPWSVLKVSVIFYFCLWLIFLLAGVLLWSFAESSGTLESVEDLIEELFTLEEENEFFSGGTIFRSYAIGTLVLAVAGVAFNVLLCVLYNLISDLTGGVRVTVIEEESARFQPPRRRAR